MREILENKNDALSGEKQHLTLIEEAVEYLENFDILETITNVGNDEVFTPSTTCKKILDILPKEVWSNPNYKWLNPATKNGIFEREIALRLNDGLKEVIKDEETRKKHILQNMIYSLGQTRFTSDVARRTLYYCCDANRKCDGIKEKGHYINGYAIGNGTWFDTAEGNILTPNTDHDFSSKGKKCKYCGIDEKSTSNDKNQRETYAYEFIHFDGDKILEHLQDRFFKGDRNMKFDVIIGNPPYQLSDGGGIGKASAIPIYQKFVQQAKALNPKYISMIMPSRWMTGGKGLDEFRDEMLSDRRLIKLEDFANSKECFPNNDIKGGVCFFLWDRDYDGACHMKTHAADGTKESTRFLREGDCDIFIRDERLISLFDKVKAKQEKMLDTIVSSRNPYGISANALYNLNSKNRTFAETPFDGGGGTLRLRFEQTAC